MLPFSEQLKSHEIDLVRGETSTLQLNLGRLCNQTCLHCHLEAGPERKELMDSATVDEVIDYIQRAGFHTVDITGGAPELNQELPRLVDRLRPLVERLMLRVNLTAISSEGCEWLAPFLSERDVCLVASLPALNPGQTNAQRGDRVFQRSLAALAMLNELGYGNGKELNLVSNPAGAYLPPNQAQAEERYRKELKTKWGIYFNNLYTFANVPLGRFKAWLVDSGNYESYLEQLASNFNPAAIEGLMCRSQISVSWDGILFDCDFNLAAGLTHGTHPLHVSQMEGLPSAGSPIAVGEHCYTCTAGSGFT